jgi:hypothetical protein
MFSSYAARGYFRIRSACSGNFVACLQITCKAYASIPAVPGSACWVLRCWGLWTGWFSPTASGAGSCPSWAVSGHVVARGVWSWGPLALWAPIWLRRLTEWGSFCRIRFLWCRLWSSPVMSGCSAVIPPTCSSISIVCRWHGGGLKAWVSIRFVGFVVCVRIRRFWFGWIFRVHR